ncbi:MAG: pitrilysin family protein, partial [Pirellulales bacterium]|nr:pitrilysin family protein [Pirellulales bacterium]
MQFREHKLDNGLHIVAECNADAHSIAVAFCVNTGARDETSEVAGVSHFLEHMVFKGTDSLSVDDVNQRFDQHGAEYNAWTGKEHTCYYAVSLPEHQDAMVRLWCELMRPALRETDFDTEKQVILEEIRMYDDQPPFGADEACEEDFYGDHPLANRVLGTEQSVTDLRVDAMRHYFQSHYTPENIVVAAAGNIDFQALLSAVEEHCGAWAQHPGARGMHNLDARSRQRVIQRPATAQQYVIQLSGGPDSHDSQRYAAHLLVNLLGDSSGSRLYWELLHPGLAEQISAHYYEYEDAGLIMTWMCCEPDAVEKNLNKIRSLYEEVQRSGFKEEELRRAKTKINSRLVLSGERPQNRMLSVGLGWMRDGCYR